MAQKKHDLEYLLAQALRIAEHREADAEKEIRKAYKALLKDLQAYIADVHARYAVDGSLSFAALQKAGYDARFLEEIEDRIMKSSPKAAKALHELVEDTYKLAYESMVQGVLQQEAAGLNDAFAEAIAITPDQIKNVVKNPVMEVALEKNHKDIIYEIKQAVAVALMNGDRYTTTAGRIAELLDSDKGAYKRALRIARTESHRVSEMGNHDAALRIDEELQKGTSGLRFVKIWRTMKDERVRPQRRKGKKGKKIVMGGGPNHMKLHGQTVLENEPFQLGGGVEAMSPGQSGVAGHDINCRCYASRRLMTDEEYFKATGKHFPGWKGEQEEAELTRKQMREKIKEDQSLIGDAKSRMRAVDRDIDKHNITDFDDLKGLKKSDITGKIKAIEDREKEIEPILTRLRNRPERGTPEYDEWREFRRSIENRSELIEEEMRLAMQKAEFQSQLRKFDRYDEWTKWKEDNPLDVLKAQRTSLEDEIKRLEDEIKAFKDILAANPVFSVIDDLEDRNVVFHEVKRHVKQLSENEIISAVAGGDLTQGSCASLGIAYIGQKRGFNVLDFRDGNSRDYFSGKAEKLRAFKALGAKPIEEDSAKSNLTNGKRILSKMEKGKEYYLSVGRHAAIVRLNDDGIPQYLELQSSGRNGWYDFAKDVRDTLKWRFGCSQSSSYWNAAYLTDIDEFPDNDDLRTLLGYINTNESEQRKGKHGTIK